MRKIYQFMTCTMILAITFAGNTMTNKTEIKASPETKTGLENSIHVGNKGETTEPTTSGRKPNIINIILDDFGWSDSSLYGSQFYETPHMDEFAKSGVVFTDAYSGSNLCSPSRAVMLTGRYGTNNGVTRLCNPNEQAYTSGINNQQLQTFNYGFDGQQYLMESEPTFLPTSEITVAEQLKKAGYTTAHIGKWHLGDPNRGTGPLNQGFDINIGGYHRGQPPTYYSPYNIPFMENGPTGEYLSDRLGEEAAKFMREHKDEPFFLNFSQYAVHTPLQPKRELVDKYRSKTPSNGQDNATYAALIESADDAIGKVVDTVKELGLEEDTIIVITSDNGGLHYWNVTSNAPLKKGKCFNYEGGIRVPTIISWKGHIEPNQTNSTPIHQIDLFPTFSEAAGVPLPADRKIDGKSLLPLLTRGEPLNRESLYWYSPHFNKDTALVLNENPDKRVGQGDDQVVPTAAVRTGDYKLIKNFAPARYSNSASYELYNLKEDIGESRNLADEMPDKVAEMKKNLEKWLYETNAVQPTKVTSQSTQGAEDFKVKHSEMTATATSTDGQKPITNILDDNNQTYWQTATSDSSPQSLTIDLKTVRSINQLSYLPYSENREGTITFYKVYTSKDGVNFDHAVSGEWANDNTLKTATFNTVNARYIKLRAMEAVGGKVRAAEINVFEDRGVVSVEETKLSTLKGLAPVMPDSVTVVLSNGDKAKRPVTWSADAATNYQMAGTYELTGTIEGLTLTAKAKITVDNDVADQTARVKSYYGFDGSKKGFMDLSGSSTVDFADNFTIQAKVKLNGLNGNWQTLVEQYDDNYNGFKLNVSPDGYVTLHVSNAVAPKQQSRPWIALKSVDKLPLNEWATVRLAFSTKYNRVYLYINDKLVDEAEVKQAIQTVAKDVRVGSEETADYGLNGSLSDIRIYNSFMRTTSSVEVSTISMKATTTLKVGQTEMLVAELMPSDAGNKEVLWESSDASVATVVNGLVTAVKEGTATITATTTNGKKAETTVTVEAAPIIVDKTKLGLGIKEAKEYKQTGYTVASFLALQEAIQKAELVYSDPKASEKQVFDEVIALQDAIKGLTEIKTGWIKEGTSWYYILSNGTKKTGWLKEGSSWYYLEPSGKMKTGWLKEGSAWYYLESSGKMKTGWLKEGSAWYYLQSSGKMKTGWLKEGSAWYYLQSSGKMKTGWLKDGINWYLLAGSGKMLTGWQKIGTQWYYLYESGKMATGWVRVGQVEYFLNLNSGIWSGATR